MNPESIVLTVNQKKLLEELKTILDFGTIQIIKVDPRKKFRPRKRLLYTFMVSTHNYAEGIHCLLKEARTQSSEVLLRSLIESTINLAFVFIGRNESHAVRFLLEDEHDRKALGSKLSRFLNKYPYLINTNNDMFNPTHWTTFMNNRDIEINKISRKYRYSLGRLPDLRQRAVSVDSWEENKIGKSLPVRLEWVYLTMYWLFSLSTHLVARAENSFFDIDTSGNVTIDLSGRPEDVAKVSMTAYSIYYNALRIYGTKFGLFKIRDIKKFKDVRQKYIESAGN